MAGSILLERSKECARLDGALAGAVTGEGRSLLIEGAAGIGKTTLVAEFGRLGAGRGFRIFRARGSFLESGFAFGVARQLLEESDGTIDPQPTSEAALYAMHRQVVRLSQDSPLLLIVDDAHWSDEPSLRFAAYLARRLSSLPVVLVLAARRTSEWLSPSMRTAFLRDSEAEHLELSPLSSDAVAVLVGENIGMAADREFSDACWRSTVGNPFYLDQLLEEVTSRGIDPVRSSVQAIADLGTEGVTRSVEERLLRLSSGASAVARAVAVLGDGCPDAWVAELAAMAVHEVGTAADSLRSVRILDTGSDLAFVHPVVRASVYESVPPFERSAMHRRAATLARRRGESAEVVAAHLMFASASEDSDAARIFRDAARDAMSRGAPEVAAMYLAQMVDADPDAVSSGALLELGLAEALARLPGAADHLAAVFTDTDSPDDRVRAAMALWNTHSFDGRVGGGLHMLRLALASSDGARPELVRHLELELARATRSWRPTAEEGRHRIATLRVAEAGDQSDLHRVGLGLAAYDAMLANEPVERVLTLLDRAIPLSDSLLDRSESQVLHPPFYTLIYCDAVERALAALAEFSVAARRRGTAIGGVISDVWTAFSHLRAGDLVLSESVAASAFAGAVEHGWVFGQAASQLWFAAIALEKGDVAEASRLHDAISELVRLDSDIDRKGWADHMLHGRALVRFAEGDVTGALADLLEAGRRHDEFLVTCPSEMPWKSDAALCHLALGDTERAVALAEDEVDLARGFGASRALGIALRVFGCASGSRDALEESIAVLSGSPARLELARSLVDFGHFLLRNGDSGAASHIVKGRELAAELGATALSLKATQYLVAAGALDPGPPNDRDVGTGGRSLSAAELRVAHLAARGMSNPEIARILYINRRTVESHLYASYKKLSIGSRSELAAALDIA